MLFAAAISKRVVRCHLLLSSLKMKGRGDFDSFQVKKFAVDAKVNRRNDRKLAYDLEDSQTQTHQDLSFQQVFPSWCCVH